MVLAQTKYFCHFRSGPVVAITSTLHLDGNYLITLFIWKVSINCNSDFQGSVRTNTSSLPAWLVLQVALQDLLLQWLHFAGGSMPTGDGTGICHMLCRKEKRGADIHSSFDKKTVFSSQVYLYFSDVKIYKEPTWNSGSKQGRILHNSNEALG